MNKPGLLLWSETNERMLGDVVSRFDVVRLWQESDLAATLAKRGRGIVATLTTHLDASVIDQLPNLRLIVVPGAGYEGIDVAAAVARGITVANAGNVHSAEVAEHAVAMTLSSINRLSAMHEWVVAGRWAAGSPPIRHSVSAQRFGIVGLGNIGGAIAERLEPFGGEIGWWGPREKAARWPRLESLVALAQWCTVLIIAARGDTARLVDADTIAAVGPDCGIVNITRGALIDEDALCAALISGRLGFAALDVFADEPTAAARWSSVPRVLLSPHVAGVTQESLAHLREAAVVNLLTVLDGGPVVNEVEG